MRLQDVPSYKIYDYDELEPGERIKIERIMSLSEPKIAGLVSHDAAVLENQRRESSDKEKKIFGRIQGAFQEWEEQAAQTQQLDKAIQYVKTPPVKHTGNRWVEEENNLHHISNTVFKMYYTIWENTRYGQKESVSWELSWYVYLQDPAGAQTSGKIAGQDRKRFTDKTAMEKYLQGRIKAYSHLFKEISPPIPKEHIRRFSVNGQLLPGYTAGNEQSVLEQLAKAKEQVQEHFREGDDLSQPPHLSPWGAVKTCEKLYSGIFQVTAAEGGGIMVAHEIAAILSPFTCKRGENRCGFLCFKDKSLVLQELADKKLLHTEQRADKAIPVKKLKQEIAR